MSVVCNTGPIIALAKADHLWLLQRLFETVYIPPTVHRELLAKAGIEAERLDSAFSTFIKVMEADDVPPAVLAATQALDAGERDAVRLGHALQLPLIIDDRLGRQAARNAGIAVTGVIGVLIHARAAGLLQSAYDVGVTIRQQGYWLSDMVLELARQEECE